MGCFYGIWKFNLVSSVVGEDTRDLFALSFEFYKQAEGSEDFYDHDNIESVKKLIGYIIEVLIQTTVL